MVPLMFIYSFSVLLSFVSSSHYCCFRYLLSDLRDESKYASVQNFVDGAINPCVQSTYRFIEKVVAALINIHKDVSPLKVRRIV